MITKQADLTGKGRNLRLRLRLAKRNLFVLEWTGQPDIENPNYGELCHYHPSENPGQTFFRVVKALRQAGNSVVKFA